MKKQLRYFQFPLCLLTAVHKDKEEGMQDILRFALVKFALGQEISTEDAARQLIYDTICGNDVLAAARGALENSSYRDWHPEDETGIDFLNDIDRYSFFAANETREDLVYDLVEVFKEDSNLFQAAIKHSQLSKINQFFGVQGPGHDQRLKAFDKVNRKIKSHELRFGNDPKPTIETSLFFDFMNNEDDPLLFACYMAIRSILGRRKYCKTTKHAIQQRMFGAKSNKVFEHLLSKEKMIHKQNEIISRSEKSKRYWIDKLIKKLQERNLITKIGVKRNLYLSCLLGYEKLGQMIIKEDQQSTPKTEEMAMILKIKSASKKGQHEGHHKGRIVGQVMGQLYN
jgi:hypothetical protein